MKFKTRETTNNATSRSSQHITITHHDIIQIECERSGGS